MNNKFSTLVSLVCVGAMLSAPVRAAEPEGSAVSLDFGADVVSSYIWRGQELGGFSIQPHATLTWNKPHLSFGVWASAELFEHAAAANMTEFDLALTWCPTSALTLSLTDYYLSAGNYFSNWGFGKESSHNIEGQIAYDFGPLAVSVNTCLTGPDQNFDDNHNFSTYAEVSAPFKLGGIDCSAAVGACLMDDYFTAVGNDHFNVCNVSLTASRTVFNLPLIGQIVFNPQTDNAYFVIGLSF